MSHCVSRTVEAYPGGDSASTVTNAAIHELDIVPWLLDSPITSVSWHCGKSSRRAGIRQDPQVMLLRTASDVLITIEVFLNAHYGYDTRCEVVGEFGTAALTLPTRVIRDVQRTRKVDYPELGAPLSRRVSDRGCRSRSNNRPRPMVVPTTPTTIELGAGPAHVRGDSSHESATNFPQSERAEFVLSRNDARTSVISGSCQTVTCPLSEFAPTSLAGVSGAVGDRWCAGAIARARASSIRSPVPADRAADYEVRLREKRRLG